jgi:hypothetical protein
MMGRTASTHANGDEGRHQRDDEIDHSSPRAATRPLQRPPRPPRLAATGAACHHNARSCLESPVPSSPTARAPIREEGWCSQSPPPRSCVRGRAHHRLEEAADVRSSHSDLPPRWVKRLTAAAFLVSLAGWPGSLLR